MISEVPQDHDEVQQIAAPGSRRDVHRGMGELCMIADILRNRVMDDYQGPIRDRVPLHGSQKKKIG